MIIKKQNMFILSVYLLIAITVFSPEQYGTTLKYGIVPLALMIFFGRISFRINKIQIISFLFLICVIGSTVFSKCEGALKNSSNFRSVCILIICFLIVSNIEVFEEDVKKIQNFYIVCVTLCGIWIVCSILLQGLESIDRYNYYFIWGLKDVNYLLSFMLPGSYLAARRILFESNRKNKLDLVCIVTVLMSILFLETRASFLTIIIVAVFICCEYLSEDKLNVKKAIILFVVVLAVVLLSLLILSNSNFARLTSIESYKENIRLVIWKNALMGYKNNQLFGSGLGSASYYSTIATGYQSHSNYIDIICDFGIVGLALFIILIYSLMNVPKKQRIHMTAFIISYMFPLAFINGFQTLAFWLPMLMISFENKILILK